MQTGSVPNGPIEAPLVQNPLLDRPEHWAGVDGPFWANFSMAGFEPAKY